MSARKRPERRDPDLISINEAADLLGVSDSTARQMAVDGTFPGDAAFRVESQWRVSVPRLRRAVHGGLDIDRDLEATAAVLARLQALLAEASALVAGLQQGCEN